ILIIVHWLCDLAWLSFVSVLVNKTRSLWSRQFHRWLFITCSVLLIGFGAWFLISGIRSVV
ncbi:MAG: lysine transporter LysE, partial [Chloroflexi bacterium]|nr:lysine transporter LysE [Chloroflexota bacterium]